MKSFLFNIRTVLKAISNISEMYTVGMSAKLTFRKQLYEIPIPHYLASKTNTRIYAFQTFISSCSVIKIVQSVSQMCGPTFIRNYLFKFVVVTAAMVSHVDASVVRQIDIF